MNSNEIELMKHAIGLDYKSPGHYRGKAYYKPYRNYYGAGGLDKTWEGLVKKGLAETSDHSFYWVSNKGLEELGDILNIHIYSEHSRCIGDARNPVFKVIVNQYADLTLTYPVSSKYIAQITRIPVKLVRETCSFLVKEGLIQKDHQGGFDDNGLYCIHGYSLTEKAFEHPYYIEALKKRDECIAKLLKHA